MNSLEELQVRYPYMFEKRHLGIRVARGWMGVFTQLCQDIDNLLGDDKQGFHWTQVKEKFGTARFYWSLEDVPSPLRLDIQLPQGGVMSFEKADTNALADVEVDVFEQIRTLANQAEAATATLCVACGKPGTLDVFEGYGLTLCSTHAVERRQKRA